jgi:hypothetical protein
MHYQQDDTRITKVSLPRLKLRKSDKLAAINMKSIQITAAHHSIPTGMKIINNRRTIQTKLMILQIGKLDSKIQKQQPCMCLSKHKPLPPPLYFYQCASGWIESSTTGML